MFVDASALVAMILKENDATSVAERLQRSDRPQTSALAVWETTTAVARELNVPVADAARIVEQFLRLGSIDVIPVVPEIRHLAIEAFDRFGKGRHPAALNFGDCFAYACARHAGVPLLCKGGDFAQTDIQLA